MGHSVRNGLLEFGGWFRSNDIQDGTRTTHRRRDGANGHSCINQTSASEVVSTQGHQEFQNPVLLHWHTSVSSTELINFTALAGVFGIVVLGLTTTGLILTILIVQFVAVPAAIGFTKLTDKWGTKKALQFSLICWCVVIVGLYHSHLLN